ncbi:hypothetical protein BCV69DRAFT_284570 [Microstroma glucosiphilum]|uniref:Transcription factor IIIC subunit 5 HTH domain-containing protein n=1 Tax=Pseudomicrostroma glucosiphilum TaxID=1684307 RepID=A0A316U3A4_9BASI|nr:hypothetical protein BCV69DRAFT_284570 [Pseudomicrostroma glucosiphilum]PWN18961.1 hypothetical protein BCV69DRAFT_284570 [Pseudomicrostroma glucosiphilum]
MPPLSPSPPADARRASPTNPGPALAPIQELPRTTFLHLEYPGIVDSTVPALHTALETLSPNQPPYANVGSTLAHLGRLVSHNGQVIECRLGTGAGGGTGAERTTTEVYRHPLVGVLVNTHDIVAVVRRRVWRKKRKAGSAAPDGTSTETSRGPAQEEVKEYSIEALGLAKLTARWRKMADFAYEPDLAGPGREQEEPLIDVPAALRKKSATPSPAPLSEAGQDEVMANGDGPEDTAAPESFETTHSVAKREVERGGLLAVHDAMARMDVSSLRSFIMPEEKEDYQIGVVDESTGEKFMRSNLRLPPPPRFSSIEIPVHYTYRQPASSSKQPYERRLPDGSVMTAERWSNANRWQGIAPIPWSVYSRAPIPKAPPKPALSKEATCNQQMLLRLRNLMEERPVWTRVALLNQLASDEERTFVNYSKEYLSLVAYTITDGAWKDTLVRFGYDVRDSSESRIYQKLTFQANLNRSDRGRGQFSAAYGGAHLSGAGAKAVRRAQARDEQEGDDNAAVVPASADREDDRMDDDASGSGGAAAAAADQSTANIKQEESGPLRTHRFNGQEFHRLQSSFQLIDISDPVALPFINASGPADLLDSPHPETGWYSSDALERIKSAVGQRFHHLVEFGVPKDEGETRDEVRRNDEKRVKMKERARMRERALLDLDREEEQRGLQQEGSEERELSPVRGGEVSPSSAAIGRTSGSPEGQRRMSPASSGRGSPPTPARRGGRRVGAAAGAKGRRGGRSGATTTLEDPAISANAGAETGTEGEAEGEPSAGGSRAIQQAGQEDGEETTVAAVVARADAEAAAATRAAKRQRGAARKK